MKFLDLTGMVLSIASVVGASELSAADAAPTESREQSVRMTRTAVESFRSDLDRFSLSLEYHGPRPAKCSSVHLSVKPWPHELPESQAVVQISRDQAAVLIGYLAADGFLYRGTINRAKRLVRPEGPHFFLLVQGKAGEQYFEFLPWAKEPYLWHGMRRPTLAEQLDGLRAVLWSKAAEEVDGLTRILEIENLGERN